MVGKKNQQGQPSRKEYFDSYSSYEETLEQQEPRKTRPTKKDADVVNQSLQPRRSRVGANTAVPTDKEIEGTIDEVKKLISGSMDVTENQKFKFSIERFKAGMEREEGMSEIVAALLKADPDFLKDVQKIGEKQAGYFTKLSKMDDGLSQEIKLLSGMVRQRAAQDEQLSNEEKREHIGYDKLIALQGNNKDQYETALGGIIKTMQNYEEQHVHLYGEVKGLRERIKEGLKNLLGRCGLYKRHHIKMEEAAKKWETAVVQKAGRSQQRSL